MIYLKLFWNRFTITGMLFLVRIINLLMQLLLLIIHIILFIPMMLSHRLFMEYTKILPKTFHRHDNKK